MQHKSGWLLFLLPRGGQPARLAAGTDTRGRSFIRVLKSGVRRQSAARVGLCIHATSCPRRAGQDAADSCSCTKLLFDEAVLTLLVPIAPLSSMKAPEAPLVWRSRGPSSGGQASDLIVFVETDPRISLFILPSLLASARGGNVVIHSEPRTGLRSMPSSSRLQASDRYDDSERASDWSERSSLDGQFELPRHSRSRSGRHQEQPRRSGRRSRSRGGMEQVERSLPSALHERSDLYGPSGPYTQLAEPIEPAPTHSRRPGRPVHPLDIDDSRATPHAAGTASSRRRRGGVSS